MKQLPFLQSLKNPRFARLYCAQTINLIGDALTWLGLALLTFELAGESSGQVLAIALTLRVSAFVLLSPIAGVIADRVDRKYLMVITHLARCGLICLLPFVHQIWQIYAIVLALNAFYAFFTPTHTATIALVTTEADRSQAMALFSATSQLLGVLGPGIAGGVAAWVGTKQVFFLDGVTFLIAAILIWRLPGNLMVQQQPETQKTFQKTLQEIRTGTVCLFLDRPMRYALAIQFVTAIAGAEILINSVQYIQGILQLGKPEYGFAMAALGIGATLAAIGLGGWVNSGQQLRYISLGAVLTTLAILPANAASFPLLLLLWVIAGIGQTLVNLSAQTLIADRVAVELQGRVYGAHFAWSHLGWAIAYPIAGWLGFYNPHINFLSSSIAGLLLLVMIYVLLYPYQNVHQQQGLWHEHIHEHNSLHIHSHHDLSQLLELHNHLHFHASSDYKQHQ